MRRLLFLVILGLIGFYVAWPAWSGYRIAAAIQSGDERTLESKIDFTSVRQNLRPTVTAEVEKRLAQQGGGAAILGGDFKSQILPRVVDGILTTLVTPANVIRIANDGAGAAKAVEKIVSEQVVKAMGGLGAVAGALGVQGGAQGQGQGQGGIGGMLGGILGNTGQGGLPGGLPGGLGDLAKSLPGAPASAPQAPAPAPASKSADAAGKASFGLGNIKGFTFGGPLAFDVSVAKDAAAPKSDVTAGLAFTGGDWKLVKLIPTL